MRLMRSPNENAKSDDWVQAPTSSQETIRPVPSSIKNGEFLGLFGLPGLPGRRINCGIDSWSGMGGKVTGERNSVMMIQNSVGAACCTRFKYVGFIGS